MFKKYQSLFYVMMFLMPILTGVAYASDSHRNRSYIDVIVNPKSIEGTYEIDRMIIKSGDTVLIDSEDDYAVEDDRGEAVVTLSPDQKTLNTTYKMQMTGMIFKRNPSLQKYSFMYDKLSINIPAATAKEPFHQRLEIAGVYIYDRDEVLIEAKFEGDKTIILVLDKESDLFKELSNSKYLFL